jgi:hypothetical protein
MLLPDNIHPENTLFYNGALILKALKSMENATPLELFVETRQGNSMSMPLFVLSLDWLYLANCVQFNEQGKLSICS